MERKSLTILREEMRAVARGDCKAPPRSETTTLFRILTPDVFELINVLATTPTTTVNGLAQRLGKGKSDMSRTLQRLAFYGIVRLLREGREVRPELVSVELKMNLVDKTIEVVLPYRDPLRE